MKLGIVPLRSFFKEGREMTPWVMNMTYNYKTYMAQWLRHSSIIQPCFVPMNSVVLAWFDVS